MSTKFNGTIVSAGNDEAGQARVIINTTKEDLAELEISPCYKNCTVEVFDWPKNEQQKTP